MLWDPSRAGLDKKLVLSILGEAKWESGAGGGQKHDSALRVSRERAAVWCSLLAAALQPPVQAGHLGSLSLPWATIWSCLEKLQQKDLSRC